MTSTRAREVAEVLWEVKRAAKLATYTAIAERAGFSAGADGKTVRSVLQTVQKDWPHLDWWRAVSDNGQLNKDSEQQTLLVEAGYEIEELSGKKNSVKLKDIEVHLMSWSAEQAEPSEQTA